jgi:hypothetical protein
MAALVRSVWEAEKIQKNEKARNQPRLLDAYSWNFPSRRLLNLIVGVTRLEPETLEAKALLAELQAADSELLRAAARGQPIPE